MPYGAKTADALRRRQILQRRATEAVVTNVLSAHLRPGWPANCGQEQGLVRLAVWRSREMIGRYAAGAADERARAEFQRAALGDRL